MRARRWGCSLLALAVLLTVASLTWARAQRSPWPCYIPGGCAFAQCGPWCQEPPIFTVREPDGSIDEGP